METFLCLSQEPNRVVNTGRLALVFILAALCCVMFPRGALAFGFGADVSAGFGRLKTTDSSIFGGPDTTNSFDETRWAAGLMYDTNVRQDRLFNYRLGISYQNMKASSGNESIDLHGVSFDNDFGFALIRNEVMRLWAGPEVRMEYVEGKIRDANGRFHDNNTAFGIAPVVGANIHLNEDFSLCLKGGYMFLEGVRIFSGWEERYGFFSIGIMQRFGADRPQVKGKKEDE